MPKFPPLKSAFLIAALSGCGGGGGGAVMPPPGVEVVTPLLESYRTDHSGANRVRRDNSAPSDSAVIAQFEDGNPSDPAGYKSLVAVADQVYSGKLVVEVLAEIETVGGTDRVKRILRLTTDQVPFTRGQNGNLGTPSGKFFLRGQNFAWAQIDGQPIRSSSDRNGLVNLEIDFDRQTANIDLRTDVAGVSGTEIKAKGLPFNITTGAYGGVVSVRVWDPNGPEFLAINGNLRGNIGGTTAFADNKHGLTTSGVYTARDTVDGKVISVDGVFFGTDPNALPQ